MSEMLMWEPDDVSRMDSVMRLDRYLKSKGVDAAGVVLAWVDIKHQLAALGKPAESANPAQNSDRAPLMCPVVNGSVGGAPCVFGGRLQ